MKPHELSAPELSALSVPEDDVTLGSDEFGVGDEGFDPLASADDKRRIDSGIILILAVVALAGGGLFSMRAIANASAKSIATNPQIDDTIEKWFEILTAPEAGGNPDVITADILGVLQVEDFSARQVPLNDVQRNPFILEADPGDGVVTTGDPRSRSTERLIEFKNAAKEFNLTSVLAGSTPLASLNNKIVRIGDTIVVGRDVPFIVKSIDSDSIVLIATDDELEISYEVTVEVRGR